LNDYVEILETIFSNVWLLLFAGLYVLGWLLKEHSNIKNALISWILAGAGIVLGLLVIEWSLAGGIIGLFASHIIIATYEQYKGGREFLSEIKRE